ncbi:hypothetical protein [uncultured Thiodictyon sp.]|uniref:hypothetical protein n=1 Tax=uncultured Thiodictyon sp. TaxID=1846217 RepID=UPI0025DC252E|nr:hypothetical protein [uncultured Thiodictyon sp.]
MKKQHGDVKRLWGKLYGQEKNLTTSAIARMNLFLALIIVPASRSVCNPRSRL